VLYAPAREAFAVIGALVEEAAFTRVALLEPLGGVYLVRLKFQADILRRQLRINILKLQFGRHIQLLPL